jgi:4-hydroxy-2-oxoheptanedioate aldolase
VGLLAPGTHGVWCSVGSPTLLALLARSGVDWVALDAQHGEFDRGALVEAGRTLTAAGSPFAVRVGRNDAGDIGLALDAGAATVVVPLVDTADEARLAVAATHYPPGGTRSWGPFAPLWGRDAPAPAQASPQLAVMVESARGLANVDAIAAVPGVDLLFVGPFDLALSLGVPVDVLLEDSNGPLRTVREAAEAAGIGVAAFAGTPERAEVMRARGIDCLAVATDASVVAAGAEALLARARPSA